MAISVFVAISSLSPAGEVQQTGNRKCEEQELQASGASVRGNAEYALDKVHRNVPGDRRLIEFAMGIQPSSTLVDRRLLPVSQSGARLWARGRDIQPPFGNGANGQKRSTLGRMTPMKA